MPRAKPLVQGKKYVFSAGDGGAEFFDRRKHALDWVRKTYPQYKEWGEKNSNTVYFAHGRTIFSVFECPVVGESFHTHMIFWALTYNNSVLALSKTPSLLLALAERQFKVKVESKIDDNWFLTPIDKENCDSEDEYCVIDAWTMTK